MKNDWIDVSATIRAGMVHWPDNPEVRVEKMLAMDRGDICNVSTLSLGSWKHAADRVLTKGFRRLMLILDLAHGKAKFAIRASCEKLGDSNTLFDRSTKSKRKGIYGRLNIQLQPDLDLQRLCWCPENDRRCQSKCIWRLRVTYTF